MLNILQHAGNLVVVGYTLIAEALPRAPTHALYVLPMEPQVLPWVGVEQTQTATFDAKPSRQHFSSEVCPAALEEVSDHDRAEIENKIHETLP